MSPASPRRPRRRAVGKTLLAFGLLAGLASPARGGWDDFEFGRRLIDKGYIEYARKVFERMVARRQAPPGRTGPGPLRHRAPRQGGGRHRPGEPEGPLRRREGKLEAAIASIGEFIQKYPGDPKADEARARPAASGSSS